MIRLDRIKAERGDTLSREQLAAEPGSFPRQSGRRQFSLTHRPYRRRDTSPDRLVRSFAGGYGLCSSGGPTRPGKTFGLDGAREICRGLPPWRSRQRQPDWERRAGGAAPPPPAAGLTWTSSASTTIRMQKQLRCTAKGSPTSLWSFSFSTGSTSPDRALTTGPTAETDSDPDRAPTYVLWRQARSQS